MIIIVRMFGVVLTVLGILSVCVGIGDGPVLIVGGLIVLAMGVALAVYYLSFGIFYDGESFLISRFGKKEAVHRYDPDSTQIIPVFATDKDGDFPTTIVPVVIKRTE